MTPKISVIIPVYNISEYLEKCLWSVTNQTLKDIEIIVVNDGSTDNSLEIIDRFASTDNRIIVLNKVNGGLVSARKHGIGVATGDYIHHFDGDDYINLTTYELLYKRAIESDSCMTIMKFWLEESGSEHYESRNWAKLEYSNIEFLNNIFSSENNWCLWQNIHKRSLYCNNIHYDENLSTGEDAYFTTQLAYYSKRITILQHPPLYHYIIRSGSITNSKFSDKNATDLRLFPRLIHDFIKSKPEYDELKISIFATELQSELILIYKKYFKGMHKQSKYSISIIRNYPVVLQLCEIGLFVKLIKVFAFNQLLGRLYSKYYMLKGKIK